jgi:AcrR family transcriptional regulator
MTRAALRLVAEHGPRKLTVAALAKAVGAPTGSIYHRYTSREELLAELWMDVVESFQNGFVAALDQAADVDGAVAAARFMSTWTREHMAEARLLLLHRRQDFVAGAWPPSLVERAAALEPQLGAALREFARRAFGRADRDVMARLRFALLDAPFGGVKPYVQAAKPPPASFDELVELTVRAVLGRVEAVQP